MCKQVILFLSVIVFNFLPSSVLAEAKEDSEITTLQVQNAWARPSMSSNNNSAAYMQIDNATNKDLTIIGASSIDIANNVELHNSFVDEKGISRMVKLDKLVVPTKSRVEMKPGSLHIMLLDLKKKLKAGDQFSIDLKIEDESPLKIDVTVK